MYHNDPKYCSMETWIRFILFFLVQALALRGFWCYLYHYFSFSILFFLLFLDEDLMYNIWQYLSCPRLKDPKVPGKKEKRKKSLLRSKMGFLTRWQEAGKANEVHGAGSECTVKIRLNSDRWKKPWNEMAQSWKTI